jgi:CheY-like chemotaxis protein
MSDDALAGKAILVAEDEYVIAADLRQGLKEVGATVVGPAPSLGAAVTLIESGAHIDAAILDINLQGKMVFTVADLLKDRSIPFLFATANEPSAIPPRFEGIVRCEKPLLFAQLLRALAGIVGHAR